MLRIPTDENTSDLLTKAMARVRHQALMDQLPLVVIDAFQEVPHSDGDLPVLAAPAVAPQQDGFLGRLFYALIDVARERLSAAWADPDVRRMVIRWAVALCRRRAGHVATGAALAYVGSEVLMITHEGDPGEM